MMDGKSTTRGRARRAIVYAIVATVVAGGCAPRAAPSNGAASTATVAASETIAEGVRYQRIVRPEGPWRVHVLTVDLRGGRYALRAARPHGAFRGRERVSEMAAGLEGMGIDVVAGINGDFFDLKTGENENNQVVAGDLLKGAPVTDSPWDTFRNAHSQFAVDSAGHPYIERFAFTGTAAVDGAASARPFVLDGLNGIPRLPDGLVLFDARAANGSRTDSVHQAMEVPLSPMAAGAAKGWSARYRIDGAARPAGRDSLGTPRAFLVAYGAARPRLDSLTGAAAGGSVTFRYALTPDRGPLAALVGGWPRLVSNGRNVGARADSLEGTFAAFADRRHARSAVGFSRDSATLYLVTVDGLPEARRAAADTVGAASVGMSIAEFADQLIEVGAWNALALDGGGSSTLFADGRVLNMPSDRAGEREVAISLFVVRRAR